MRDTDIKDLTTSTGLMSTKLATFENELGNLKTQIGGFQEFTKEPRFTEETFRRAIAPIEQGQARNQRDIERVQEAVEKLEDAINGDRKIKRPFPPTASAHPMPPCPLRPAPGVGPHAPRQRLASAGGRRQATGLHRSARTGRVAGDGQPARLELLGGRLLGVTDSNATRA
jgi:hypothetical protein